MFYLIFWIIYIKGIEIYIQKNIETAFEKCNFWFLKYLNLKYLMLKYIYDIPKNKIRTIYLDCKISIM